MGRDVSPFVLGVLVAVTAGAVSIGAQARPVDEFPDRPVLTLKPETLNATAVTRLLTILDAQLKRPGPAAAWAERAQAPLAEFVRQVQRATLSSVQETRIARHLDMIARAHPRDRELVAGARRALKMRIGQQAPDIVSPDLDGRSFALSDYRGKVVVLQFSADWCAICRTQEPYERFLLEQYRNWPLALVSVEGGELREHAKQAKSAAKLNYRSWWDPPMNGHPGPIAMAWNVVGFPRTFVLDRTGVIRFVDVRDEDLLKGVRQLLNEN